MQIRNARPDDHPVIVAVVDDWWDGRAMSGQLSRLFLEHFSGTSLVAEDDGELVGFLVGFLSQDRPDEAYVHFVGVRPDQRGAGVARMLYERFEQQVAALGASRLRCVTSTVNEASVRFHTSIGFTIEGTDAPTPSAGVDDDHGHVLMSRQITPTQPRFVAQVDPRPADPPYPTTAEDTWPVPAGTRLTGHHVELTVSDVEHDAFELFTTLDSDRVWAHVAGRPSDVEGVAHLVRGKLADPTWCPWTVRLRRPLTGVPAGALVGTTSYLEVSPHDARGEIGSTTYAPDVWATVVNPECKLLLLGYAFDLLGWGRVQLKTDIRNHRSQQAIARLGARYEGTLRRYQRRADGSVRDTPVFSVTREDWPQVRDGLVQRVAAHGS
ncbi:MAG: GNAT family N-acetyltransferase [Candidatus Nanopelagicales bacterium]